MLAIELVSEDTLPRGTTGAGRPGHTKNHRSIRHARHRPGLDGSRTDFIETQCPKHFAETLDHLVKEWHYGLRGRITS